MKVRNTGGGTPITPAGPITPTGPVGPATPVRPAAGVQAGRRVGDVATVIGLSEVDLTPKVKEAIDKLMAEVENLRGELDVARKRVEYLEQLADEDALVPVLNRRAFVRELTRTASFADRYGITSSVIYFDMNGMKQINDRWGHAAGDQALHHVATVLVNSVRASDVVGRLGGDEFGLILTQSDGETAAAKAASLAAEIAAQPLNWRGETVPVAVAYGVHTIVAGEKVDAALEAADRAMYMNKRGADDAPVADAPNADGPASNADGPASNAPAAAGPSAK